MYVREKPCVFARNCLAAGEARPALSWLGPEPELPRRQQPAWGKTGLFARRFATYRVALSLHVAALARRRPQRPGCVAAALPARGSQCSQPRRGVPARRRLGASSCYATCAVEQWQAQTARWDFRCCSGGVKPSRRPRRSPARPAWISPPAARIRARREASPPAERNYRVSSSSGGTRRSAAEFMQ